MSVLPVVVVGAGPAGLAAAAELVERGPEPLVLERGDRAGTAVAQWNHVRLFSPCSELVAPAAGRLLEATGGERPSGGGYPTGADWASRYLRPAERVELMLPESGVCGGAGVYDEPTEAGGDCCGPSGEVEALALVAPPAR